MKPLFVILMSSMTLTIIYIIHELFFSTKFVEQISGIDRMELEFLIRESEEFETQKLRIEAFKNLKLKLEVDTKLAIQSCNKIIEETNKTISETNKILKK